MNKVFLGEPNAVIRKWLSRNRQDICLKPAGRADFECFSYNQILSAQGPTNTLSYRTPSVVSATIPVSEPFQSNPYLSSTGGAIYNIERVYVTSPYLDAIGESSFKYCKGLTDVDCRNMVSIDQDAFSWCDALSSVNFPAVTVARSGAFLGAKNMTHLNMPSLVSAETGFIGSPHTVNDRLLSVSLPSLEFLGNQSFFNCAALTSVSLPSLKTLNSETFYGCSSLVSAYCPSLTEILGAQTFTGCVNLSSFEADALTVIGNGAFAGTGLTSVEFPSVGSIGLGVFQDCLGLSSVDLPRLTFAGDKAFAGCRNLTYVDFSEVQYTPTRIGIDSFNGIDHPVTVYVKTGMKQVFQQVNVWQTLIQTHKVIIVEH